ncbi:MAG: thcD 1 [Nocardia sp.]|uniref:NAD(P)/FAD-dependent oxidoreductase n=1 Tax=Nocardia sp. TaxID=1821 RepID=UPI0026132EFB|nr:FAD-dependent oxidoreductase [Nocardia sp.]MCU1645760.1 thcD 1 [Nocardia sp.]
MTETYIVVGASLAGARAVETLRTEGFDGRIVLVGAEEHLPYDRPPLSKEVVLGHKQPGDTLIHPAEFYSDNSIELLLGRRATRIDTHFRRVELAGGTALHADKVLLCTGTSPRRPDIPGLDLDGVHFLRTVEDSVAIRDRLGRGGSVVIVGGGLIGMELAAAAVAAGNDVTVLERDTGLLRRVLGARIGDRLSRWHSGRGVRVRTNAEVARIEGDVRVRRVHTTDGFVADADLVVIGIGVVPAVDVVRDSGFELGNGIVVDEFCETSVPGVYAAGDVANHPDQLAGERIRLEHWQNAQNQGIAAARTMVGRREPYREVPWFWSDQGETNIQGAGHPRSTDELVWRGDPESMDFTVFHLRRGVLVGVVGVNRRRDVRMAMNLIDRQVRPEPALLADPTVDIRQLGDGPATARSPRG